jgi:Xaa-Pro aminopeptidase
MYFSVDWVDRIDFATLRQYRKDRLQEKMKEHGLDALICFRAENIRYMTGMRPLW